MTIAGFSVIGLDRAFAWADSQCFSAGEPFGDRLKVHVHGLAGLVLIGTGFVSLMKAASTAILDVSSFGEAMKVLPPTLRREILIVAGNSLGARSPLPWQAIGVVGWSTRHGRVIGALFEDRLEFEPSLPVRSWRAPAIERGVDGDDEHSIAEIALAQFAALRVQNPTATPSGLVIAEIGPAGIRVHPPRDLRSGRRWFASGLPCS